VALVLLDSHRTLSHGADLLCLWISSSLGRYCSRNVSQNSSQVMNVGFGWEAV
jgi:hypothetical protein